MSRTYPRGKARLDDEGQTTVAVAESGGTIFLRFEKPIAWLGLGADEAKALAMKLLELAERIKQ